MNSWMIAVQLMRRTMGRRMGIFTSLLLPALAVSLVIGIIGGSSPSEMRLEVVNRDRGAFGDILVLELEDHPEFRVHLSDSQAAAEEKLIRNLSEAIVTLPELFTENVLSGQAPQVDFNYLRDNEAVYLASGTIQYGVEQLVNTTERLRANGHTDVTGLEVKLAEIYREKREKGAGFRIVAQRYYGDERLTASVGIMVFFLLLLASTSVTIIMEDRRNKTLQRMFSCPLRPVEISVGYLLGCFILGTVQIVFVLLVTRFVMHYDFSSDFLSLLLVLECFLLAAMGVAAALAGVVQEDDNLNAVNSVIITPSCMLGGCFWPLEIMPDYMQKLANFVPQKWAIEAAVKLSAGAEVGNIGLQLGILLLFGVILLSFGGAVMRPGEEERI